MKLLTKAKELHIKHTGSYSNDESVTCPKCKFHAHVSMDGKSLVQHWDTLLFVEQITDEQQLTTPEKVVSNLSHNW
jgi:hypothetical protein